MARLAWNNKYNVGIAEIDEEHRKLVDLIEQLGESMENGDTKEKVSGILNELANYTIYHFTTEETLFARHSYPEASAHKSEHKGFVDKVIEFRNKFDGGSDVVSEEILGFLYKWLINHINVSDKKYAAYFADKGVTTEAV